MTMTGAVSMCQDAADRWLPPSLSAITHLHHERHQSDQQRPHGEHVEVEHRDAENVDRACEQSQKRVIEKQEPQKEKGGQALPFNAGADHEPPETYGRPSSSVTKTRIGFSSRPDARAAPSGQCSKASTPMQFPAT